MGERIKGMVDADLREERKFASPNKKKKKIKINLLILKNLELHLSVAMRCIRANLVLDNTE